MSKRFDSRTKEQFKKDIFFGTALESYFFYRFKKSCQDHYIPITNPRDNGVGNDGEFVESGNTSGADYMLDIAYDGEVYMDLPLEVKWVPTHGKFTLKKADLQAYTRESAAILFIYTSKYLPLKKPRDLNVEKHIKLIEDNNQYLRWGIMSPDKVANLFRTAKWEAIPYMGNKIGVILKQDQFYKWFREETF
jgi:hypothetical protein